ncbi:hypothetical protein EDD90_4827 [Streptomyces sp. Ag109_O5-1]|nr:hypothetical protein EDD90_4827 [Streptomyces sp. Ag109_O5-1]
MTVVSPKVVVVVPTCNERGNLPVLAGLPANLPHSQGRTRPRLRASRPDAVHGLCDACGHRLPAAAGDREPIETKRDP